MKRLSSFLVLLVTFSGLSPVSHSATAKTSATFYVQSTPNAGESLVTFYGQVNLAVRQVFQLVHLMDKYGKSRHLKLTHQVVGPGELQLLQLQLRRRESTGQLLRWVRRN